LVRSEISELGIHISENFDAFSNHRSDAIHESLRVLNQILLEISVQEPVTKSAPL